MFGAVGQWAPSVVAVAGFWSWGGDTNEDETKTFGSAHPIERTMTNQRTPTDDAQRQSIVPAHRGNRPLTHCMHILPLPPLARCVGT